MTTLQTSTKARAFDLALDLEALGEFQIDNRRIGSLILSQNKDRTRPQFVLGFATDGVHSEVDEEAAEALAQRWEEALCDIPQNEHLTVITRLQADDTVRQQQLNPLLEQSSHPLLQLMVMSEKARVQQLTDIGQRQLSQIQLFATYTPQAAAGSEHNHIDKLLGVIAQWVERLQPPDLSEQQLEIQQLMAQAYSNGYLPWETLLTSRMGLTIRPLTAEELWWVMWQRLHAQPAPPLPQRLVWTGKQVREEINTERHPSVVLTRGSVPQPGAAHIKLEHAHVGVVSLMDKPQGWGNCRAQLRMLLSVLAQPDTVNTEFIAEFSRADPKLQAASLQLLTRQANTAMERSLQQNSTDVAAELKADQAVEARQHLLKGSQPTYVAFAALVYRQTASELQTACARLISHFPGTAWLEQEQHVAGSVWLQSLPITRQSLLRHGAFDQRSLFFSQEAVGFLPLLKPRTHDARGAEFIAEDGGIPLHIDLEATRALLVLATSRAGKSVLIASVVAQALAKGCPVNVLDYPRPDGSSTFKDLTQLVGGAYIDVAKENSNLFEIPNLWAFDRPEIQQERLGQYQAFLHSALMQLVVGRSDASDLPISRDTLKSILILALAEFFQDASIMARYRAAYEEGFGSHAWRSMPILPDFIQFLSLEVLALGDIEAEGKRAMDFIQLRLRSWCHSPGVGQALSQVSTVPSDAPLTVFAFTNVNDEDEAAVLALVATGKALSRSLSASSSIFLADEAPILFRSSEVSKAFGRICASGLKAGIHPVLLAQDPDTIAQSAAGAQILQNLNTRLVGRIQPTAVESFVRLFGYPREVIKGNATAAFAPNPQQLYSQWLLDDGGTLTRCRFYPAPVLLALTANNPAEHRARTRVLQQFPEQPIEGIATFAQLLVQALQAGQAVDAEVDRWLTRQS